MMPGTIESTAPPGELVFAQGAETPTAGPTVQYTRVDGRAVAVQVFGAGPSTIVLVPGFVSHVELHWQLPGYRALLTGLAGFARVVAYDKPGTGLSDPLPADRLPTLEERIDELAAVMDHAGVERATVLAMSDGGPLALAFAALRPERVERLVLYGSFASLDRHPARQRIPELVELVEKRWGAGDVLAMIAPSLAASSHGRSMLASFERRAAPPTNAARILTMAIDADARAMLPLIEVPTLVVARDDDRFIGPELSRDLTAGLTAAQLVTLPGRDHWIGAGDADPVVHAVAQFLGTRPPRRASRRFAVLAFVDVVDSTGRLQEHGDRSWTAMLADLHGACRRIAVHHEGRIVKTIGDGLLATFSTPSDAIDALHAMSAAAEHRGLVVRGGLHAGEVEVSDDDVAGVAVHVAARVEALAEAGEAWVTRTIVDLVAGSRRGFDARGDHRLKGFSEPWSLYAVVRSCQPAAFAATAQRSTVGFHEGPLAREADTSRHDSGGAHRTADGAGSALMQARRDLDTR
jgi:pimeloyl-ACP methyl ester carboxylesterase